MGKTQIDRMPAAAILGFTGELQRADCEAIKGRAGPRARGSGSPQTQLSPPALSHKVAQPL